MKKKWVVYPHNPGPSAFVARTRENSKQPREHVEVEVEVEVEVAE